MSLVLLAIVIVIWASLLLPLIFRDRSTWPSRQAPAQAMRARRANRAGAGAEGGAGRWAARLHGHAPPSTE